MFPAKIFMLLLFISILRTNVTYECDLPLESDFVITLLYNDSCEECEHIITFLEMIDSRLERNGKNVAIRYKNCSTCKCDDEKIDNLPEVIVNKKKEELGRVDGKNGYRDILNMIVSTTEYNRSIFETNIKNNPGHVVKLKERDFFSGFNGPWLVLFYAKLTDSKRELIFKIAEEYENNLNVGEIEGNGAPNLMRRFSISYLPTIVAFYNGLIVGYSGPDTHEGLKGFVDELIKPSFESITLDKLNKLEHTLNKPIFVVFYKDLGLANEYYQAIAHEYKFKSKIYKSDDKDLIEKAGIDLKEQDLKIAVYKNNRFHEAPYDATKNTKIFEWVWHSHYPLVTKLDNNNFYSIMHGLKPIVFLLTRGEYMMEQFEHISEINHKGMPFADYIFSSVDVTAYPLFVPNLLPNLKVPWIVIFNPITREFYTDKMKLSEGNVTTTVQYLIEKYTDNKLSKYPFKSKKNIRFIIGVCLFAAIGYVVKTRLMKQKVKLIEI